MTKSNVIAVDFRPHVRNSNIDELDAELEAIDAALTVAHARARQLEADMKSGDAYTHWPAERASEWPAKWPMRWCRRDPLP